MALLILGLVLFIGIHSTSIVAEDFRNRMAAKSELGWKAFYGIVAIVGIVLIVKGYAAARMETAVLYTPPTFVKHIALTLMLPAFILFLAPYFPGRIKAWTKHPMLVSVKLWAVAHLLANGTVADVVLFGSFLAWAVVDRISMKRRVERPVPSVKPKGVNDVLVVFAGLGIYLTFLLWLHELWFGVSPIG
jgi:uncharacterized membrane protein